jgi:hypothetical protein
VVGRVNGEACGASSGPGRSGTKFRGTDGKEEPRGCAATRCSSDSIACFPARPSTSPTRVVSISTAPASMIVIGPCLTAHRSAVRIMDGAYRPAATYAGVSREEKAAELVELGGTPGAPGTCVCRLHGEAEVPFPEQGVRERAGLCEDVSLVDAISRGNDAAARTDGAA